ncbi:MAG: hypothetical protein D3925_03425, partial [Candidatus Electrothrix sp. AR5]|nr:hypothetical protein [Candidatus Electrothrix sp. AR5]
EYPNIFESGTLAFITCTFLSASTPSTWAPFLFNAFIATETERHGHAFHGQGRPDINERSEVAEELNAIFRESIRGS